MPEILKEGIRRNRIFSTYLFIGPGGSGKLEAATNLAKAVNCLGENNKPCGICLSCNKINSQVHPDVFFVEPKDGVSSIGIDQIREVISRANLKPYEGKSKVFIINNANSMNIQASNAFLKTLEEPPENTIFILISPSKELLLSTIVSRCHMIRFFTGEAIKMKAKGKDAGVYPDREALKENLEFLISFFRDIFLYKIIKNEKSLFHRDKLGKIKDKAAQLTQGELDYLIKKLITLRSYIDYNVNPRIIMDVLANEIKRKAGSSYKETNARNSTGKAAGSR
ncbi:MAG: DNA polymerase III subunit delta' [Candidatus Omnitrophota bacterium]|nr:MAG: DNA polymerase III subunit delta' [Candidatus Omnitrophota bacterium]